MYVTFRMAAVRFSCSEATIRRRVKEMEASGMYPTAVRRIKGVEVDPVQLNDYCTRIRGRGNEETISNSHDNVTRGHFGYRGSI